MSIAMTNGRNANERNPLLATSRNLKLKRSAAYAFAALVLLLGSLTNSSAQQSVPIYVQFHTNVGNIDVQLLPDDAPLTVANFLRYVDRGAYDGTFVDRSVLNFVIQGGGYKYVNGFVNSIATDPPVINEFKISNRRGTLAMAKLNGDPNSATSHWFFNISDSNAANLDFQNGGYTVFGRIVGTSGLTIMDRINALPIFNFGSPVDQVPLINYTSGTVQESNLVKVFSVTRATQNTPAGPTVTTQAGGSSVTYSSVSQAGSTTFTPIDPASAGTVPSGFALCATCAAYDITTSAVYTPPVNVCLAVPPSIDQQTFLLLALLHRENGVLIDRTTNHITNGDGKRQVCGTVQSLSPFVLAQTSTPTPCASTFQLDNSNYVVNEGGGFANISVKRSGDTSCAATVDFQTSDVGAEQRTDYTLSAGTLTFAAGDTSKSFSVPIVDDLYVEGSETLTLTLSNPSSGAQLTGPSVATLTITDNDSSSAGINPLDTAPFFVQQHYYDFLSRYPDPSGWDYWTGQITQCGTLTSCLQNKRIDVSNAFFYELEYQQTAAFVFRLYRVAFGNNQPFPNPDAANSQVTPAQQAEAKKLPSYAVFSQARARLVGSSILAQDQLALANTFVQRAEFSNKYSAGLTLDQFVDQLLTTVNSSVGVDLSSQRATLINLGSRGAIIYRLANDDGQGGNGGINNRAFIDAEYNRSFVASQYFGYLRRDPDIGGFIFWLGQINGAPLRDVARQHALVCSQITSAEYQQRFSSVVTHSNVECSH